MVWSSALGLWVVAAETTRGRKKGCVRRSLRAAVTSLLALSATTGFADAAPIVIDWSQAGTYSPPPGASNTSLGYFATIGNGTQANDTNQHLTFSGGSDIDIKGPIPTIMMGSNGSSKQVSLQELADSGAITSLTDSAGNKISTDDLSRYLVSSGYSSPSAHLGMDIEVPGINGGVEQITIYDSNDFQDGSVASLGDQSQAIFDHDSVYQYNGFGIAHVTNTGGNASIDLGADTSSSTDISAAESTLRLYTKDTSLTLAEGDKGKASQVHWNSDNYIQFGGAIQLPAETRNGSASFISYDGSVTLPEFGLDENGKVVQTGEQTFDVHSLADIAKVNDWLTQSDGTTPSQIQLWLNGNETINGTQILDTSAVKTAYQQVISGLLDQKTTETINWTYDLWDDHGNYTGNLNKPTGPVNIITATGKDALGEVTKDGSLAVSGSNLGVMHGENDAQLINNGAINTWNDTGTQAIAMYTDGASATNNGTINAGLFIEKDGTRIVDNLPDANGNASRLTNYGSVGMYGVGASTLDNKGTINVALTDNGGNGTEGIHAAGSSKVTNEGHINVVANPHLASGNATSYGANISDNASFVNEGDISLGVNLNGAQLADTSATMVGGSDMSAAVHTTSNGDVTNNGTITLGSNTRNSAGLASEGGTGKLTNNGTINVLGGTISGSNNMAQNYGLYAHDVTNVLNNGDINVKGAGNLGLKVYAENADAYANVTNRGVITLDGDGNQRYRNYAVYVASQGYNHEALADIDSKIILDEANAIGVHVRNNATANLDTNATVDFNAENQIGYYAYGEDATINTAATVIGDNGQDGTTLFRIDHGAKFDGSNGNNSDYTLNLSGENSVAVLVNGVSDLNSSVASNINTGNSKINVGGVGSTGVKISGGATGTITDGVITLNNDQTTAVEVDGSDNSLDNPSNTDAVTKVTSTAKITTGDTYSNVTGYKVHDSGELTLTGDASLDIGGINNVGVDIGNKGTFDNQASGGMRVFGNGPQAGSVGVLVEGKGATVKSLGNIIADGGEAAVKLIDGAGLTVANANGKSSITASNGADGILLAAGAKDSLDASNLNIDVTGTGAGIQNNANSSDITLNNVTINAGDGPAIRTSVALSAAGSNNVLNVQGSDPSRSGAGFAFEDTDAGKLLSGDLNINNSYTINVHNDAGTATGNGVRANTTGSVTTGTTINVEDATGGSAVLANDAKSVTQTGNITSNSDSASTISAKNASDFSNSGVVQQLDANSTASVVDLTGGSAGQNKSITNSGSLTATSSAAVILNADNAANNTIENTGKIIAANGGTAVRSGSGNDRLTNNGTLTGETYTGAGDDTVLFLGGAVTGNVQTGDGSDTFTWTGGTFDGNVDFAGTQGNDQASVGNVDMENVGHIITESSSNNTLTLTDTHGDHARIGSLDADGVDDATNIGTGWNDVTITGGSADVRIVDNLQGVTGNLSVTDNATMRTGANSHDSSKASIGDHNVITQGSGSRVVMDGAGDETYTGVISGDGQLERGAGGKTVLLNDNTYTGQTTIDNTGTLQLGDGGATGGLSEKTSILDNGRFTVDLNREQNLNGAITGTGSLHQDGTGLTRLNGNNAYKGETQVNQGTLIVNGNQSAATGDTTVASGATLGGHGTIGGNVTIADGATLTPGDNNSGTLTIGTSAHPGSLTLGQSSVSDFEFGQAYRPGGNLNDLVNVTGDLTLGGTLNVSQTAGGSFTAGVYRIFNYNGTLTNPNGLTLGSLPSSYTNSDFYIQTNIDKQVNLVNDGGLNLQFWDGATVGNNHGESGIEGDGLVGGGDGYWAVQGGKGDNNWTHASGIGNSPWAQNAYAIFEGKGGNVTVDNGAGQVMFAGGQFVSNGYVIKGEPLHVVDTLSAAKTDDGVDIPAGLGKGDLVLDVGTGSADDVNITATIASNIVQENADDSIALVKLDQGRLILTGDNDYKGGTRIEGGTLQVSAENNLGASGTQVAINNNSTLQNGADWQTKRTIVLGTAGGQLDLNSHSLDDQGQITGDGQLTVKSSSATADSHLTLRGTNDYQGGTLITGTGHKTQVIVDAEQTEALGNVASNISLKDGATLNLNNDSSAETHHITDDNSLLAFNDNASAGKSVIDLTGKGKAALNDNANGAQSQVNVASGSELSFNNQADGGQMLVDNKGKTVFTGDAQASGATVTNEKDAIVDITAINSTTSIGSLSGAGNVLLGNRELQEGALGKNDSISGIISGASGSLTKQGGGTLTLSGNNTYGGATHVQQGTLLVNGDQHTATGNVTVDSGTTLGGSGNIGGAVDIADNAHIAAGSAIGKVGTLTTGSLSLHQDSQLDYQLGQAYTPGGANNDLINVNGDLSLDGKLNITQSPNGKFVAGVYRLINYTGDMTANNILDIASAPEAADSLYVQTSIDHQVNLVNNNGLNLQFWDGATVGDSHGATGIEGNGKIEGGDGVWAVQGGKGDNNWTSSNGEHNAPWAQNAYAIFEGKGGSVTVDNGPGQVNFAGGQFASDGYVVSGDALHVVDTLSATKTDDGVTPTGLNKGDLLINVGAGTADDANMTATIASDILQENAGDSILLAKQGAGRLILSGDNQYTGGTRIDGGTLQVSSDKNLGTSGTQIAINNGSTLQNGGDWQTDRTIALDSTGGQLDLNSHSLDHEGKITGAGILSVGSSSTSGDSHLTLNGDSDYAGGTLITGTGGKTQLTVDAQQSNALGSGASEVSLKDGATLNLNNDSSAETHHFTDDASLLAFNDNASAGQSVIDLIGKGKAALNDNANGGQSQVNVASGTELSLNDKADGGQMLVDNKGEVDFTGDAQASGATVTNEKDATVDITAINSATSIGSLSGAGNVLLGDRELQEGALGKDDDISGVISGDKGSLTKQGSGTLTLTGMNTYGGATHVEQGVLLVNGDQSKATGNVSVDGNATLGGDGILGGAVDVADNGHIAAGSAIGNVGLLTIGSLSLHQNSQLDYQLGQAYTPGGQYNDLINVNGDLSLDGKLNITQSPGGTFDAGVYRLINYTGDMTANNTLDIASAPEAAASLYVQTSVDHQVNLVNDNGLNLQFWDGQKAGNNHGISGIEGDGVVDGGAGVWSTQGGTGDNNWTHASGVDNAPWAQNAYAIFENKGGAVTVDDKAGDVEFAGGQFASDGYVVSGDALYVTDTLSATQTSDGKVTPSGLDKGDMVVNVGGGTADDASMTATIASNIVQENKDDAILLDKEGAGRLILTGANQYKGGTRIDAGTLQVSADNNLGTSGTTVAINNNSTLQNGADWQTDRTIALGASGGQLDLNSHSLDAEGKITGAGLLSVGSSSTSGNSHLTLNGDSDYAGGTKITGTSHQGGLTVDVQQSNALGNGTTDVSLTGDATLNLNKASSAQAHHITDDNSLLTFNDTASAGQSVIDLTNGGEAALNDRANGGNALVNIASGTQLSLNGKADGGQMLVDNKGKTVFTGDAQASGVTIANEGDATVDITAINSATSIGSLFGAGNVLLGNRELQEGALGKDDLISGIISGGNGSLTKQGNGTLILTGTNTYGGATHVEQGALMVDGNQQLATGKVSVDGNATLGGNGIIGGAVDVADNGHIAAGSSIGKVGTLTTGSLSLHQNSQLDYQLGQAYTAGGNNNDLINVNGDLSLDGKLNITQSPNGNFVAGVYRLINYTGDMTANNILDIASAPDAADSLYVQTSIDHQVNLVNDNGLNLQFWDGAAVGNSHGISGMEGNGTVEGGDGAWTAQGGKGDNNWTHASGIDNAPWAQNAYAIFENKAGTVTVDNSAGNVEFAGGQFASDGYVVKGDALHVVDTASAVKTDDGVTPAGLNKGDLLINVGAGSADDANMTATIASDIVQENTDDSITLVKQGSGRLILDGHNAYKGGTRIDDGTLQISADNNLGASGTDIAINNNATLQNGGDWQTDRSIVLGSDGGKLDLNSHSLDDEGKISGSGKLTVGSSSASGNSHLTLNGDSDYAGGTLITGTGGKTQLIVDVQQSNALGKGSTDVSLKDGATLNLNNASSAQSHHITDDASLLTFNDNASAGQSVIDLTGKGNAELNDKASGGQSKVNVASGSELSLNDKADGGQMTVDNKGEVVFTDDAQASGSTVTNEKGATVDITDINSATSIGSLSGAGNVLLGNRELQEGALGKDDLISGLISGASGSLTKQGNGTLTLTGANSYGGATHVDQGTLLVNGDQHQANGNVSVAGNATLGGNGVLGGAVDVANNGHITAGATVNSVGTLTTGTLTLHQDSQLDYQLGKAYTVGGQYNDLINVNGDVNLDGKLNITQSPGGDFETGIYRLINYTGKLASDNTLDIANAPDAADRLYVQTSVDHQVNLVNRNGTVLRFWDGTGGKGGELKNNNVIDGGDGVWQNSLGNDNWTTDDTKPAGAINAPFDNDAFAVFEGKKGTVTVDDSLGDVYLSGAQFITDGYLVQGDALNTHTAETVIRVGDGTEAGLKTTATIDSVIQGTGGLVKSDAGTLILNGDNTYQAGTTIRNGVLQVSKDVNLGAADGSLTLNGGILRYGKGFDTDRQVVLGANGGGIDTNGNNSTLLTALQGNGLLTKLGDGTLMLTQDSKASGGTDIAQGVLKLGNGGDQGSVNGNIKDDATLVVDRNNKLNLSGDISGKGTLVQYGSGTTELSGHNSYSGITSVLNGVLQAGGGQTLSAASVHEVASGATLDTQGYNQQIAGLYNQGRVNLHGKSVGSELTVKGDYVGDNGVVAIAAQQQGQNGNADKLVIDGGKASGYTRLDIDISRLGAPTKGDGIEVVEAKNGATTTAQTTKDAFGLGADHLEAGAFSYSLFAGDAHSKGENWYLRSDYRSEVPLIDGMIQTARQSDMAVLGNLHLRMGDDNDSPAVGAAHEPRAWARYINTDGNSKLNDAPGTSLDTHTSGVQVGSDLWTSDHWQTGVYASLTDTNTSVSGEASGHYGYVGKIKDHATHIGGYATWTSDSGWYVDNVLQYGWHDMHLKTSGNGGSYDPNGTSLTASVETGKPFHIANSHWDIEPQAQLYWQHSDFDNINIKGDTATKAKMNADDAVTARIGARLVGHYSPRIGKVTPYVRVNLWQGLSGTDSTSFTNATAKTNLHAGQRYSSTEVAAGMTWSIKPTVHLYGEVGHQWSNKGGDTQMRSDLEGSAGIKIDF